MKAGVWVVSSCLDMAVKIKVVFPYREVPRQQPGLWKRQWNCKNRRKHCVLLRLRSIYMTSVVNIFFFPDLNQIHCEYLRSLFLPELHFSLYKSLSPARLLLQSFLQVLPSPALLLQSLPAHLHLTLLHRCGYVWESITSINKRTHPYTQ